MDGCFNGMRISQCLKKRRKETVAAAFLFYDPESIGTFIVVWL